jgi:crossover junction endodeoxyribonuclease RuvC
MRRRQTEPFVGRLTMPTGGRDLPVGADAETFASTATFNPEGPMKGAIRGDVIGVDLGLDGAVATIGAGGVEAAVTPTLAAGRIGRRHYDAAAMARLLAGREVVLAVIEAVGAMPGQGLASTFGFGVGYGLWLGLLAALQIPHQAVTPQAWNKVILAGTARDKAAAIAFASRRYPALSLLATPRSSVAHDGIADAVCLAEYARRQVGGV